MFTDELSLLALYGLYMALTLVGQATGVFKQFGMGYMLSARDEDHDLGGMSARLDRALTNSVVAMALFAPAILILAQRDQFSPASLLAAQAFLVARVLYVPFYVLGTIGLRSLVWTVGFVATIALYVLAL